MKKNAGFIMMDSALAKFLYDALKDSQLSSKCSNELLQGFRDLMEGELAALTLGLTGNGESFINMGEEGIAVNDLKIYPKSRRVLLHGEEINLTPKEFDILYFLAKNRGEIFTKEQIYQAVWAEDYLMSDGNIMAFIRKLRKKIEPNPDSPEYILTIWGIGYKFTDRI